MPRTISLSCCGERSVWSAMCDGECPSCGKRQSGGGYSADGPKDPGRREHAAGSRRGIHFSPYKSEGAEWVPSGAAIRAAEFLDTVTREDAETPLVAYTLWTFLTVWLAENTAQNGWDDLKAEIDRIKADMAGKAHA